MKTIVCEEPGKFALISKEWPTISEGNALIKIKKIGICGTDLHAYAGNQAFFKYPRILGHELAAVVEELHDEYDGSIKIGDKVVVMPYLSCGKCIACSAGKTNCCQNISVLGVHSDGGMQEAISVPIEILIKANHLSLEEIAIVEPLAIGAHAIRRADVNASETIVVLGCGPIGLGIMKLAQIKGAKVIAMDMNQERLAFAKAKIGVDEIINVSEHPVEQLEGLNGGNLAHVVFDATGNKYALEHGIDYMCHGGRFVLVGLSKGDLTYNHPKIHAKETTLMCSRNATTEDFVNVMEILETGQFPTAEFVTHQVAFLDMIEHFDHWLKPEYGVIKAMLTV